MQIILKKSIKEGYFKTLDEYGNEVWVSNNREVEEKQSSPMGLFLRGIAGCCAIDITSILHKQRYEVDDLEMHVKGMRSSPSIPNVFTSIHLLILVKGDIPLIKVKRAIELSLSRYCSAAAILKKTAKIYYSLELNEIKEVEQKPI
ncbi:OsmC family protein [Mesonia aquimarina]|uniref:OsmC family protein n=1 Tax=Mesonia aquimarina TaxID=1504967 RepID=UPI000EF60091|nr:OsmC family protein [Mesonia aquimarina]